MTPLRLIGRIFRRVVIKCFNDDVMGLAAQMAFFFLLSLFPFLLIIVTLLPYFIDPLSVEKLVPMIATVLPPEVTGYVRGNIQALVTERREGLLSLSFLTLVWSASGAFGAMMAGINIAYKVQQPRPIWKDRLVAIGLMLVLGTLALLSVLALVFGELLNELAARRGWPVIFWAVFRWVAAFAALVLAMDIVYYTTPNVKHRWRWGSPGALIATPAWIGVSLLFRYYLSRFGRYEATHGALATVISMMLWFYLAGLMLLVGAELNAVIEREVVREARPLAPAPAEQKA